MQYKRGQFVGNHGLSSTITNLTKVAIWRSNGFRIHLLIAEKKTTLLFQGTFGHTVAVWLLDRNDLLTWSIRSQEEEPSAGRKRPLRQGAEVKADKATIIRWL